MESGAAKIATAWLAANENLWAHHELGRLCEEEPLGAWRVIETLIVRAKDDDSLKTIGVGPLEDLLAARGEDVISEIERSAAANPRVKVCLSATAQSTASDAVWARVQSLVSKGNHAV